MRKIFDLYINDNPFPVFSIEGKEHQLGTNNGCPNNWWLDYTRDDEGKYLFRNDRKVLVEIFEKDRMLIPFIDKGVRRICWEIIYRQKNFTKLKWGEYDIRSHGICVMKANGRDVYKFYCDDLQFAMTKVQYYSEQITCHPYNFFEPEKDEFRKIYFKSLPAFVRTGYDVGEIMIQPDYSILPKEKWWDQYRLFEKKYESEDSIYLDHDGDEDPVENILHGGNDIINWGDALSDGQIGWFRG